MSRYRSYLALVTMLGAMGCGAIFNGTRQTITANSSPDQTTIKIEPGGTSYTTPASLSLERKNNYNLTFSKDGYQPATFEIRKSMNGGILILDILSGLVGVIVDAATGGWYNLSPENATVTLTRTSASVEGPATIQVMISDDNGQIRIESSAPGVGVVVTEH
jgi:hypothetical protein